MRPSPRRCRFHLLLLASLLALAPSLRAADSLSDLELIDADGARVRFSAAFGEGHAALLVTKPWVEANEPLLKHMEHYRIRLNKGGLRTGVVFVRSDRPQALSAMEPYKRHVRWYIDPAGAVASALEVKSVPALLLVDPEGRVKYRTPLLSLDQMAYLAERYARGDAMLPKPRTTAHPSPAAGSGPGTFLIR